MEVLKLEFRNGGKLQQKQKKYVTHRSPGMYKTSAKKNLAVRS